ncbi:MAG: threonine/serine dehydratase [Rhodobacteraceae bacterium]|nr:threonine/serine dehydratase [Paracoccaceae bacterium]
MNLTDIHTAADLLNGKVIRTPVIDVRQTGIDALLPEGSNVVMKLELLQKSGSFKARGCYLSMNALTAEQRQAGVVAASGGNHALAVAWAARNIGVNAKIAVPRHADPIRLNGCRDLGAEVILCDDIHHAFEVMDEVAKSENRSTIHPFEGLNMSLGAATCGLEFHTDAADLDIVILPVGGGGLISGMSAAFKLLNPSIEVYGVEPNGADTMFRSFQAGSPQSIDKVSSIADSLCAPTALPISYGLARKYVTDIVKVSDDALRAAMRIMNTSLKLMPEPACAASLAGALGPLREKCEGKNVGLLACGSNISLEKFAALAA